MCMCPEYFDEGTWQANKRRLIRYTARQPAHSTCGDREHGGAISQNAAVADKSGEHGWAPFEMEVIHVENVRMPAAGYRHHLRGVFCEVLASENVCMKQQLEAKKLSGNDPVIASESRGRCPAKKQNIFKESRGRTVPKRFFHSFVLYHKKTS